MRRHSSGPESGFEMAERLVNTGYDLLRTVIESRRRLRGLAARSASGLA